MIRLIARSLLKPQLPVGRLVTRMFHVMWYHSNTSWIRNTFLGFPIMQNPFDLQIYQEILFDRRPKFVLQTGVAGGGSMMYFAAMLDLVQAPPEVLVIGVDIVLTESAKRLSHPRIRLVEGSSVDESTIAKVRDLLPAARGMVILDSDHSEAHVTRELACYADFVEPGQYLVIEDTNVNGHPVHPSHGPGPLESVQKFIKIDKRFVADDALWQRHLFSNHQFGWLKRILD